MTLVIRDSTLIATSRKRKADREPDWATLTPLAGVSVAPEALAEILRLHATRFDGGLRANLRGAYLGGAYLGGAYLRGAYLGGAYLGDADLGGAYLGGADLPAPTMALLASWGELPAGLTVEAMRLDAACHPDPVAFDRWAAGGPCPYNGVRVQRACTFSERRDLWSPGPCPRPYDLMTAILAEKCPPWSPEKIAEFEAKFAAKETDHA